MKDLFKAANLLFLDLASTVFFLILFLLTHNTLLSVSLGVALGLAQMGIQLARRTPIGTIGWLSLFLIIAAGFATVLTEDPRFVLFKPSVIYTIVGIVMLKRGWMNRYLPPIAKAVGTDVGLIVGFAWAGLMFVSAVVNAIVVLAWDVQTWAIVMPVFGIVSKLIVFLFGFAAIRFTVRRRIRSMPARQREMLLGAMGYDAQLPSI